MQLRDSPFDTAKISDSRIQHFKDYFWHSSEICNGCFTRVREVGDEESRMLQAPTEKQLKDGGPPQRLSIMEYYERTEHASQEYTPWDSNRRFGTCFCLECGSDCSASDEVASKDELLEMADRIAAYTGENTPLEIDSQRMLEETDELKSIPRTDGWDTEILAVAFTRALQ